MTACGKLNLSLKSDRRRSVGSRRAAHSAPRRARKGNGMNAFTLTMSDEHAAREVDNLIPRDVGLTHIREGGEISATHRDAYYTLARVEQFESPFVGDDASRVVQEEIGGTTYVVTETDGFVSEEYLGDVGFWEWMGDDMAVVAHTRNEEEPHTGMICEYTGQSIKEPWYQVWWTDSSDTPSMYETVWDAISGFVDEVTDVDEEDNGWMLRHVNVTIGMPRDEEAISHYAVSIDMNRTGDIDTHTRDWGLYPSDLDGEFTYYHTWEFGDHDDMNSPLNQFHSLVNPERLHDAFDVGGFASFVREDFSGEFIVHIGKYEG